MGNSPSKTWNLNQAEKTSVNFFWIRIWKFSKKMYFIAKTCLLCSAFLPSSFFLSFFCWKFNSCYTNRWNCTKAIFLISRNEKDWNEKNGQKNLLPSSLSGLLQAACQRRRRRICSQSWQIQFVPLGQMLIYLTIITFTFYPPINAPW